MLVSARFCYSGKGTQDFVEDKVQVNADHYTSTLLPQLIDDCNSQVDNDFIFQQDGAPANVSSGTGVFDGQCS